MTSNNANHGVKLVRGWVFRDELATRGFALVQSPDYGAVLVHQRSCRRVSGTFRAPRLESDSDSPVLNAEGGPDQTWVVLDPDGVRSTDRGWRAGRWGVLPKPDEVADLKQAMRARQLSWRPYVGGEVYLNGKYRGQEIGCSGTIESITLDLGRSQFVVDFMLHRWDDKPDLWYRVEVYFNRRSSSASIQDGDRPDIRLYLYEGWSGGRLSVRIVPPIP